MDMKDRQNVESIVNELEGNLQELSGELSGGNTTRDPSRVRQLATTVQEKTEEVRSAIEEASYESVEDAAELQRAVQDLHQNVHALTGVLPGTNTTPDPSELYLKTIRGNVDEIRSALSKEETMTEASEDENVY